MEFIIHVAYKLHFVLFLPGQNCETEVNECLSNPCNGGQCLDLLDGFQCKCPENRAGKFCERAQFCNNGKSYCTKLLLLVSK